MKQSKEETERKRPICGKTENQMNAGKTVRETKDVFAKNAKNIIL